MNVLQMFPTSLNERYLDIATEVLRNGGIIVYPTDTLYAIGCDALNRRAIERICAIKGINPQKTNLSIICSDFSQAAEYARIDNHAFKIMKEYLPGPFTFLLPAASTLPKIFKDRKVVGVRIPDNAIATQLAATLGNPLLTTSIQWDNEYPDEAIDPQSVQYRYRDIADLFIDGGDGSTEPSTVVDLTDSTSPQIVRQGAGQL
jgi:tRNA threonylcarbamoyl adenosine modification protein (Sua5/YciO/YrdC/YwlC family)